jgi:sugar lactone lactonase YvrE
MVAVVTCTWFAPFAGAQARTQVTINDTAVTPENLTSSRDGTVYFGSMAKGTIYRAAPGSSQAEPWILASTAGLTRVLGVLADDRSNTLWVCQNATGGRDGAPMVGQTALRSFDLASGAAKGTYPLPRDSGVCNDIAVAADGGVYVSESFRGRVHRLKPGATQLEVWASSQEMNVIDGLAFLADGSLYANDFTSGKLFRIPVNVDGSAGALVTIETSMPFVRPDGLRTAGPQTLIQAEQQGRVTELTISGNRAEVRVIRDGLPRAAGVTIVGNSALVLVELTKAVVVPYPAGARHSQAEQELLALSKTKWRWMSERKVDTLAALFHDEAVFVHMSRTMSRDQELEVIRTGGIHYKHAEIFEASVRIIGPTAIVLNRIRLDAVVRGEEVTNPFTVTEVYVQQGGKWKLGSLSFTRLTTP